MKYRILVPRFDFRTISQGQMKTTSSEKLITTLSSRQAIWDDAIPLVSLINSAYRGDESRLGWTTEADFLDGQRIDEQGLKEIFEDPQAAMLVFFDSSIDGEALVGTVYLKRMDQNAYLGMLSVKPSRQGTGLGKFILKEAEAFVRAKWNSNSIEMTVIAQRPELIAFYERYGYCFTGERRPFPYHELKPGEAKRLDLDFIVLERKLI